jgi:cell shape-determining protein MreC
MSVQDWAGLILTVLSIVAIIAGGIKFLVKHYFSELKTNGGSSMRDEIKQTKLEVKEIKDRQNEADQMRRDMNKKLDRMYEILLNHVANNSK